MTSASVQTVSDAEIVRTPRIPAFVWILVGLLLICQIAACVAGAGPSLTARIDLRAFYASGMIVRHGQIADLYNYELQRQIQDGLSFRANPLPFLYPPFAALLFWPLAFLSYRAAFFTLVAINLLLLFFTARVLISCVPSLRRSNTLVLTLLFGCLFGVSIALMQGQISFLLLLLYSGSYALLTRNHHFKAGLLLALCLVKLQLVLPVILLFLLWKNWHLLAGFLVGGSGLGLLSLALVGRSGVQNYLIHLTGIASEGAANAAAAKARYGMFPTDMPNLHGLTFGLAHGAPWGQVLNAGLCLLVLAWAARQRASLLVALPAAMLVSYHMQPHDLTLLLLPLSVVVSRWIYGPGHGEDSSGRLQNVLLLGSVLLLTLPLAAFVMARGMNFVVSVAVASVMVLAASAAEHKPMELRTHKG